MSPELSLACTSELGRKRPSGESRSWPDGHNQGCREMTAHRMIPRLIVVLLAGLNASAFGQQAEIEAVNAKWMDFFNAGVMSRGSKT